MEIYNKYIQKIDEEIIPLDTSLHISDCIVGQLDFVGLEFKHEIVIERCIIKEMKIHSYWFVGGLSLTNSIILSEVDYQMGGHNEKQILLDGNIFKGFFF